MHCRNTTALFILWRCNTLTSHTSHSQRSYARNEIHWIYAESFTQTKWPQEKWKLFHQYGLKVFQDAQLWIFIYSSFPLCFWAAERLLKVSLKKENSYEAFTWTHQGSIQVSNHPYPMPWFLLLLYCTESFTRNSQQTEDVQKTSSLP